MRRASLTLLALAALATPAAAQDAAPVVGGGSFNDAPLLEPGTYRDTILGRELLYYGIDLKAGQRLRVGVRVDADQETFDRVMNSLEIEVFGPLREDPPGGFAEDLAGSGDLIANPSTDTNNVMAPVEPLLETIDGSVYEGPGVWYVGLYALHPRTPPPLRAEIPIELELEVLGEPVPEPPDPTVTAAATSPQATPGSGETAGSEDDGGASAGAAAGIGAAGLLLGALAGAMAGRRRR